MNDSFYDAPPPHGSQGMASDGAVIREMSTYMTDRDAEKVCQLFADGLSSGVGYSRIFDFMDRQRIDSKMTQRLRIAVLEYGDKLGEAFARFGVLDAPMRKLVLVAEEQGALPETFAGQAKLYAARYKRKKQVIIGVVEPCIMVCLALFGFRGVFGGLIEMFQNDMGPILWRIGLKALIQSVIFFMFFGGFAYTWMNLPVDSAFREATGRIWYRLPVVSKPMRLQAVANFARYLRQSLRSGMDVFRSVELAAEASNSPWFMGTINKARDVLEAGYPLEQALRQLKGLPDEFTDYVGIGEETGRLEENLVFLADRYDVQATEAFELLLRAFIYVVRMSFIVVVMVGAVFSVVMLADVSW